MGTHQESQHPLLVHLLRAVLYSALSRQFNMETQRKGQRKQQNNSERGGTCRRLTTKQKSWCKFMQVTQKVTVSQIPRRPLKMQETFSPHSFLGKFCCWVFQTRLIFLVSSSTNVSSAFSASAFPHRRWASRDHDARPPPRRRAPSPSRGSGHVGSGCPRRWGRRDGHHGTTSWNGGKGKKSGRKKQTPSLKKGQKQTNKTTPWKKVFCVYKHLWHFWV